MGSKSNKPSLTKKPEVLFNDGKLIETKVGSLPKSALETWIKSII